MIPQATSAEGFHRYVSGRCLGAGLSEAWRPLKAWLVAPVAQTDWLAVPAVSEPFLAWTRSGEVEFQEREAGSPIMTHRLRRGSFFLTTGGAPYDCRWRVLSDEPFHTIFAFLDLVLLRSALEETFGAQASRARLNDLSAFADPQLDWIMDRVGEELVKDRPSPMYIQGLATAISVHLARNYAELPETPSSGSPSLPDHKLKELLGWIDLHSSQELDLQTLADQAELSKFHFHRLFKGATGLSPWQYQSELRLNKARKLLRETANSVVAIGIEVGYSNPSHFARLFRKSTGLSPSEYRRRL